MQDAIHKDKVYLAGPDVFLANAHEIGHRKRQLCRRYGFEGLFPLDHKKDIADDAAAIFRANCLLMEQAEIGFFNLTPFRSPSADVGTVFELGFMFARGKTVYGYSGATGDYAERVAPLFGPLRRHDGRHWDHDGYAVEDFGLADNLMIERALADVSGGGLLAIAETESEPLAALAAFEACLAEASRRRNAAKAARNAEAMPSGA